MALEDSRKNHIEQSILDLSGLIHTVAVAGQTFRRQTLHAGAKAGENMKVKRHCEILGGSPEALVMLRVKWQIRMRHLPDHGPNDPLLLAALHFDDRLVDVVDGNKADTKETVGRFCAIVDQPVIVGSKQGFLKRRVFDAIQTKSQAGIENFGENAVLLHVG